MRPDLDPCQLTPDERRHEIASILARGIVRLRDRTALATPDETNPTPAAEKPLALSSETVLSGHVG